RPRQHFRRQKFGRGRPSGVHPGRGNDGAAKRAGHRGRGRAAANFGGPGSGSVGRRRAGRSAGDGGRRGLGSALRVGQAAAGIGAAAGALVARWGEARVPLPGGCAIGSRPLDLHLKGLRELGAEVDIEHGFIVANAPRLVGTEVYLDFPSVGATENLMMAATAAKGTTVIYNAAKEDRKSVV